MKSRISLMIFFLCLATMANAQQRVTPNKPFSTLRTSPGFVSINEVTGGFGLITNSTPDSKYFYGFTTILGYQLNISFTAGAGIGVSFYDKDPLVPLFLDFRYSFMDRQFSPYLYADGGLLLNTSNLDYTKLFINPGVGGRYTFVRKFAANASIGVLSQVDGVNRASFLNFKIGGVYVF